VTADGQLDAYHPGVSPAEEASVGFVERIFGSRRFFRLWLGMVCSAIGDWLGFLATADLAARLGGERSGALAVGFVFMARIVPGLLLGPFMGVLVDRWDRKRVMITCDIGRALVLLSLPFVGSVPGLIVASLVLELFTLAWAPAKEATVPNIVPTSHLAAANSLSIFAGYGTFPIAAALFGAFAKFGEAVEGGWFADTLRFGQEGSLGFYVDAATFLVAASIALSLDLPRRAGRVESADDNRGPSIGVALTDLADAMRFIRASPVIRAVNIGLATGLIGGGMLVPLGKIFIERVLGAGSAGFGLFLTVLGVGVAAGVVGVSLGQRFLPKERTFVLVVLGSGLCLFGAASVTTLTPAAVLIFGLGACAGTAYVLGFTLLHETVTDEFRGRIFAALNTLVRLCLVVSFAVGPFLTQLFDGLSARLFPTGKATLFGLEVFVPGIRVTLWLAAVIMILAGVLAARTVGRRGPRAASIDKASGAT